MINFIKCTIKKFLPQTTSSNTVIVHYATCFKCGQIECVEDRNLFVNKNKELFICDNCLKRKGF